MPAQGRGANRPKETHRFSSEAELVERLIELLPGFFSERGDHFHLAVEVKVGRAIADVVVVVSDGPVGVKMWPLSIRDCVVLAALRRKGATRIDLLEGQCGLPRLDLRNGTLDRLEDAGLIGRSNGGRVELTKDWLKSVTVIAIEAKLAAWRAAVRQAQEYLRYADEAYVALPNTNSNRGANDVFTTTGVGLLQVGAGNVEATVRARGHCDHDWRREFTVSRILAATRAHDE